jgi:CrcB protein
VSAAAWAGLAAAGGLGAVARFAVESAVSLRLGRGWLWGTFAVNVSGALALGVLSGAEVGGDALRLAGAGFVGAYTTFSGWMLEAERLAERGAPRTAALDLGGPLAAGLAAMVLGRWIGGTL